MTTNLTPRQQVYAFWGAASNPIMPMDDRLACALEALKGLQKELETAEQEAQLLADQRDAVLDYMGRAPAGEVCQHFDPIYRILITDPKDAP